MTNLGWSDERYELWKAYKKAVKQVIKEMEELYDKETDPTKREEVRSTLNGYYQTDFALEHNLI